MSAVVTQPGSKPEVAALRRDVCFTLASAGELPLEKHVAVVAALIRPVLLWVFSDVGAGNQDVRSAPMNGHYQRTRRRPKSAIASGLGLSPRQAACSLFTIQ